MGDKSAIEWTDATWNPVVGCSIVSPGCTNCYAMAMAARIEKMQPQSHYAGTTRMVKAKPVWTGKLALAPDHILTAPLRWKRPRRIFVNSMGDLFHEDVPDAWIDRVFAIMALSPQHTFQCLTKRASRMRGYSTTPDVTHGIAKAVDAVLVDLDHQPEETWKPVPDFHSHEASRHGRIRRDGSVLKEQVNERFDRASVTLWQDKVRHGFNGGPAKLTREQAAEIRMACRAGETQQSIADRHGVARSLVSMIKDRKVCAAAFSWPLPNVWLGVSAEDQARANERIPDLRATPAAVRFVSAEPLLGRIEFTELYNGGKYMNALTGENWLPGAGSIGSQTFEGAKLDWIIAGGESGPGARPMNPDWPEDIMRQCRDAGTAFFFKQDSGPRSGMKGRASDVLWSCKEFPA